jgi:hypothetical protein
MDIDDRIKEIKIQRNFGFADPGGVRRWCEMCGRMMLRVTENDRIDSAGHDVQEPEKYCPKCLVKMVQKKEP